MHEIAATQGAAELTPEVFEAIALAYAEIARSPAGAMTPEQAAAARSLTDVLARMEAARG
jgi:hypothetical protein